MLTIKLVRATVRARDPGLTLCFLVEAGVWGMLLPSSCSCIDLKPSLSSLMLDTRPSKPGVFGAARDGPGIAEGDGGGGTLVDVLDSEFVLA